MKKVLLLLLVISQLVVFAQKTTSKKAMKYYEEGIHFRSIRRYEQARDAFEKAVKIDPEFVKAHVILSKLYKQVFFDKENWIKHVEIAAKLAPNSRELLGVYFDYAKFLFAEENYQSSLHYLDLVLKMNPSMRSIRDEAQKLKKEANYGMKMIQNPLNFRTRKLNQNINKGIGNYFPTITADNETMLYTILTQKGKMKDENLMISKKVNGNWGPSVSISDVINTPNNREGASTISGDGKTMVFTKCGDRAGFGSCDLYICFKEGNEWSKPKNLGAKVNGKSWDSNPSLSADGRTLYFSSDRRKGSMGGRDIWISTRQDTGWTEAKNAGPIINTVESEIAPFIHANGQTLYYSSTGNYEQNMGGFDFFKYNIVTKGKPQNLGYPINTAKDETTLFITSDGKKGYFSKDEPVGMRGVIPYIYEFDVPETVKPSTKTNFAKGNVYDLKTKNKLGASIEVYDLNTNELVQKMNSDKITGDFLVTLNEGGEYGVYVTKKGYLHESVHFNYSKKTNLSPEELVIGLKKLEKGMSITLNNIFFESGSYELDDKSISELNKVVTLLKENKDIKVEISGHTDDVGSANDNNMLSNKRASSVKQYLVNKGVSISSIIAKGYGETKPKVANDSDINRAKNRRIEFKIL